MKLISLNTWCGKIYQPLITFIKQHSKDTDIFCFQEMQDTKSDIKKYSNIRANLLSEIKDILPEFQIFYFPIMNGFDDKANPVDFDLTFGQAIFAKNSIKISSSENYLIYKDENSQILNKDFSNLSTPLQYLSFRLDNKEFAIFNFHGTPFPGDKLDSKRRLVEATKVKHIIDSKKGTKILVGDFNLLPQTQSIKIFENSMRNLIKDFDIEATRSKLSPYFETPDFQKYADYTFISHDIDVKSFNVPEVEISDHLPMILQFS